MAKRTNKNKRVSANERQRIKREMSKIYSKLDKEKNKLNIQKEETADKSSLYGVDENDEDYNFIRIGNTIHDKTCTLLRNFSKDEQIELERYDQTLCECDTCKFRTYMRIASDNFEAIKYYEKVFLGNYINKEYIKKLIFNGMTIDVKDYVLYIHYNEDDWKINFRRDNGVVEISKPILYHNNYIITDVQRGKRKFIGGYHTQTDSELSFLECLNLIETYSFNVHKQRRQEEKEEKIRSYREMQEHEFDEEDENRIKRDIFNTTDKEVKNRIVDNNATIGNSLLHKLKQTVLNISNENPSIYDMLDYVTDISVICNQIMSENHIDQTDFEDLKRIKKSICKIEGYKKQNSLKKLQVKEDENKTENNRRSQVKNNYFKEIDGYKEQKCSKKIC